MTDIHREVLNVDIFSTTGKYPSYQTVDSSGMDLEAALGYFVIIQPGTAKMIPTGIHVAVPSGYEAQIRSRSGLAAKSSMFVLNSPGTVDADYRGEIKVILYNAGEFEYRVQPGDRIAQMVICPVLQANFQIKTSVDELGTTIRGQGGFGSTNKI